MSPKMRNKHAFSPDDIYEINFLFHNRKSYFDLKPHNIFQRCWFMTYS